MANKNRSITGGIGLVPISYLNENKNGLTNARSSGAFVTQNNSVVNPTTYAGTPSAAPALIYNNIPTTGAG